MANYTSSNTGANIDSAVTDVLALVGAGLSKDLVLADTYGIDFSATSDAAGMTSEVLDDYEEGLWTPEVADATSGGNTAASVTITSARQKYTKIGNRVWVDGSMSNIDTTGMTGGNALHIRGCPYTSSAATVVYGVVELGDVTIGASAYAVATVAVSDSWVKIKICANGATTAFMTVAAIDDATNTLSVAICYDV